MTPILLTIYVMIWPVIVAATLAMIIYGFAREAAEAKRDGERLI